MDLDYHELCKLESCGVRGSFGLKIMVAVHPPHYPDGPQPVFDVPAILENEKVSHMMYDVRDKIEDAVRGAALSTIPQIAAETKAQREGLLRGFANEAIYVEELPNGYCKRYCCAHLPWYQVTTKVGRIQIGWRKSVINIDWSDTRGTLTSKELFANEDTTKDARCIHAWDYDKAKSYVNAILTGKPL